jgi:hypothetical protein
MFYPDDPGELHTRVLSLLAQIAPEGQVPKAIIVPHAGYVYSGPVAASAYARLRAARNTITRVVLMGPSHRVGFHGIAVSGMDAFASPLGEIPVDKEAVNRIRDLPGVSLLERAHTQEHSLEVHLPFLQEVLGGFKLVPLVAGDAEPEEVGAVLEALWGGPETLITISSDLSHYHDYRTAKKMDTATSRPSKHYASRTSVTTMPAGAIRSTVYFGRRAAEVCTAKPSICAIPATPPAPGIRWSAMALTLSITS